MLQLPAFVLTLLVLVVRLVELPADWEPWLYPSVLGFFSLWQLVLCKWLGRKAKVFERTVSWLTFFLLLTLLVF